jgi:DNA-binding NtrC family response regulator
MKARPRVLIVDDMPDYLRALTMALRTRCDVETAMTVDEAKAICSNASHELSLALVDVCLKEADPSDRSGLELVRWLRSTHPELQAIAMSAVPDMSLPEAAESVGAVRFLQKPISVRNLFAIIESITKNPTP